MKYDEMEPEQKAFLVEIDGMIEATQEFIADDAITPDNDPDGRHIDLAALNHVRALWGAFYLDGDDPNNGTLTGHGFEPVLPVEPGCTPALDLVERTNDLAAAHACECNGGPACDCPDCDHPDCSFQQHYDPAESPDPYWMND